MKILFLSGWFPYPPDNGSRIRIFHLMRALAERHEVTLLSFGDQISRERVEALCPLCRVAGVAPTPVYNPKGSRAVLAFASPTPRSLVDTHSPEMARLVQKELGSNGYEVVVASEISTASYVHYDCPAPAILEDLETATIRDAARLGSGRASRLRASLTWLKTRRYVRTLLPHFAACTVVSEQERANLRDIAPANYRLEVVPNGCDTTWRPDAAAPQPGTLVFNGSLTYSANYDAMSYFVREIWPQIRKGEPSCQLKITGRTNNGQGEALAGRGGVHLTGYLADVRPAVAGAWACVVPLRVGGGTRLKILEAMALGTPVVSTSKGAEGLEVTPEENILIADDPADFAAQTVRLLRDPALRARLAENGKKLVEQKYDWRVIGERFNELVESVVEARKSARYPSRWRG